MVESPSLPYRSLGGSCNLAPITLHSWKLQITTLCLNYTCSTLSGGHLTHVQKTQARVSVDLGAPRIENNSKWEFRNIRWKVWEEKKKKKNMEGLGNPLERKAHFAYSQHLRYKETNAPVPCLQKRQESRPGNLCSGMGQVILAVTVQKEISVVLISHWADKRQEGTLMCPEMCTFTLLLLSPANCLRARRCPRISFPPRVPNLFSLFTSPAPQLLWGTIAKDAERKINMFYIDFLILGRFMNFPSVMQKLAFFTMRGKIP